MLSGQTRVNITYECYRAWWPLSPYILIHGNVLVDTSSVTGVPVYEHVHRITCTRCRRLLLFVEMNSKTK